MRPCPLWRFYAAENSYFSAKVRPALRYKGIHFAEILPTPAVYREVIRPRTGLAFIPILVTPEDETLQDTSEILDALEERLPSPPLYPATPVQRVVAYLLEVFADEFLLLPAMHYRWSTAEGEAAARVDFAAASGDPATAQRFADRMHGSLPLLGVTPATGPAIEAFTHELLALLSQHFEQHRFLLGDRPSLGDCALMGPLYAHLRLDPVSARVLRERALPVLAWIERMNHPDPDASGEWLPEDRIAPTLRSLLSLFGRDAVPLLLANLRAFEEWADARPADLETPPRGVGLHETSLRGIPLRRFTSPYGQWMVQRPLDAMAHLAPEDRVRVNEALAGTGCEALLAAMPRHRLVKLHSQLAFVERP